MFRHIRTQGRVIPFWSKGQKQNSLYASSNTRTFSSKVNISSCFLNTLRTATIMSVRFPIPKPGNLPSSTFCRNALMFSASGALSYVSDQKIWILSLASATRLASVLLKNRKWDRNRLSWVMIRSQSTFWATLRCFFAVALCRACSSSSLNLFISCLAISTACCSSWTLWFHSATHCSLELRSDCMFVALSCFVCFSTFNALTFPVSFTICALKDRASSITVSTFSSSPITSARTSSPFHFFGTKHSLRGLKCAKNPRSLPAASSFHLHG